MALIFDEDPATSGPHLVRIDGVCGVEEAMPLLEFLQSHGDARIDMRTCTHLHSAALQVLMVAANRVVVPPEEEFLARWLIPMLGSSLVAGP
jgi:hypothetical protein